VAGPRARTVPPNAIVALDASATSDPDGHGLRFAWSIYPGVEPTKEPLVLMDPSAPIARLAVPVTLAGRTIPVLLTVTDRGDPPLTRYARVLITVEPGR
jgi:hypothetical protein